MKSHEIPRGRSHACVNYLTQSLCVTRENFRYTPETPADNGASALSRSRSEERARSCRGFRRAAQTCVDVSTSVLKSRAQRANYERATDDHVASVRKRGSLRSIATGDNFNLYATDSTARPNGAINRRGSRAFEICGRPRPYNA